MKTKNEIFAKMNTFCLRAGLFTFLFSTIFISCGKSDADADASGTFETIEVIVSAETAGKILAFSANEGQILKAGEVIGCIDSTQLYLSREQILASKKAIQSRRPDVQKQIAALEQQISTAKSERNRLENLVKANAANQKQLDDATAQIAFLLKQLDAQKTTLQNTNEGISDESKGLDLQIEQLDDQLSKCKITSPIDGTLLLKYAEMGEIAAPGKALFKIANTQNMILRAYITADQITKIKTGQRVKVLADFGENDSKEFEGIVSWISDKSEFTPKTIQTRDERANLVYAVKISVKNDGYLKIGMYGDVKF
jgi:HlyD family secretion protein